jgi:hypothetical protein
MTYVVPVRFTEEELWKLEGCADALDVSVEAVARAALCLPPYGSERPAERRSTHLRVVRDRRDDGRAALHRRSPPPRLKVIADQPQSPPLPE